MVSLLVILTFKKHITDKINKANIMLKLTARNF